MPPIAATPYESHVQSLFSFALGVISGVEGMRRWLNRVPFEPQDLPEAYVFAGGALDSLAGDALLRSKQHWFLIEMKRVRGNFKDERDKPRVDHLFACLRAWRNGTDAEKVLLRKSFFAHRFVYGCRRAGAGLAVSTESYPMWLGGATQSAVDLASFLLEAGTPQMPGFTLDQLVTYVAAMNTRSGTTGSAEFEEFVRTTFSIAVSESGQMTATTMESTLDLIREHEMKRAATPQRTDLVEQDHEPQIEEPGPVFRPGR